MQFDLAVALLVFGVIFIAELPDKSMFAALLLGNRYPAFYVWLGAASAFFVHVIIAVAAAKLLTLLPHNIMELVIGLLFLTGSMLLFFGKHGAEDVIHKKPKNKDGHKPLKVFATAFSVIFIGEWGDITQIATANYAAKYHDPLSVAIGATAALWVVAALGVGIGSRFLHLVPAKVLLRIVAVIMLLFAILSFHSALAN
ncbi:MAG TPA: TMEM165/GDT1 family protein [Candidatus Saccharimonadales bacterium]|nr:TMEM165/GDT1 family protein [Candidatus Saccharimonadales bacterium]